MEAKIYLDESGNTGSNLLDATQPYFSLVSCNFTDEEAKSLIHIIKTGHESEKHFINLRRKPKFQAFVLEMLSHPLITNEKVSITLMHKEVLHVSYIVDILIESTLHEFGFDLYKNGTNIALVNLLSNCLPTFYPKDLVYDMYKNFRSMILEQTDDSITVFYDSVKKINNHPTSTPLTEELGLILQSKYFIKKILSGIDKDHINPAFCSLFAHAVHWSERFPHGFTMFHDSSSTIKNNKELFNVFINKELPDKSFGYDRRSFNLPLKSNGIFLESSENHLQLQVADIISGSIYYPLTHNPNENEFARLLLETNLEKLVNFNFSILPSTAVTPEELGTNSNTGCNPVDSLVSYLRKP